MLTVCSAFEKAGSFKYWALAPLSTEQKNPDSFNIH